MRIVLTTSAGSFSGFGRLVPQAQVEERPLLTYAPPADWTPFDQALTRLTEFQAVAFTSPRATQAFADRTRDRRLALHIPPGLQVWAIGPATAGGLEGILGPLRFPSELGRGTTGAGPALAHAMLAAGTGSPVLYPCGEIHREGLPGLLRRAAIEVHEVVCYRSVLATGREARSALQAADILVVGSPRVAELVAGVAPSKRRPSLVVLGPTTAAAARRAGWPPDAEATRPTSDALAVCVRKLLDR